MQITEKESCRADCLNPNSNPATPENIETHFNLSDPMACRKISTGNDVPGMQHLQHLGKHLVYLLVGNSTGRRLRPIGRQTWQAAFNIFQSSFLLIHETCIADPKTILLLQVTQKCPVACPLCEPGWCMSPNASPDSLNPQIVTLAHVQLQLMGPRTKETQSIPNNLRDRP